MKSTHALHDYNLHDHAGARWLSWFSVVFVLTVLAAIMMFAYPHLVS